MSEQQGLILSVDGGGTKTEACLADTAGHVLGIGRAAGSNALSVGARQAGAGCHGGRHPGGSRR